MTVMETTTCFGLYWPSSGCLGNLRASYMHMRARGVKLWTRELGTPPAVKGLIWFTDGYRTVEGTGVGVYGQSVDRRLSISLGKHATVFQAEVYTILACVHETETQDKPEKNVGICSESQGSLKVLKAAKTSPLVRQCQEELNDMSTRHTVGLYWVPGHAGVCENEIATKLARGGSVERFVGPETFLGVSRQNLRRKKKMLDRKTTSGIVACSLWYTETGSRIDFWP